MKTIGWAVAGGLAGVTASVLIVGIAASQWKSMSDKWLFAASVLPSLGVLGGSWWGTPKDDWPPGRARLLQVWSLGGLPGGLSGYLAFGVVTLTWNGVSGGDLLTALFSPSSLPDLYSSRGPGSGSSIGWVWHAGIGAAAGTAVCIQAGPAAGAPKS